MENDVHVRPYTREDATAVQDLHPEGQALEPILADGGYAWVVCYREQLIAYAFAAPLPGLSGMVDLQGYVAPVSRRQGVGSRLLQVVLSDLKQEGVCQISHEVPSLEDSSAAFLQRHGFYLEHVEWEMSLNTLSDLPPVTMPPGCELQTWERDEADEGIERFRRLYDESFSEMPWYQPYSQGEITSELQSADELLFLSCDDRAIGFAWVRRVQAREAEIEPLGVARAYQGKGWGGVLLGAILRRLESQRIRKVYITVWQNNEAAIQLYRRFGFQTTNHRYYLGYDLTEM